MATTSWSTDTVTPRETMAFWREAVCATVVNVTPEAPRERFRASISGRNFGALRFAAFHSTRHAIVRDVRHVDRAADDHYLISLQQRGRSQMEQGGRSFWLEPGEIGILDGTQPFRILFPSAVNRLLAVVPRRTLELRAPWLRRGGVRRIVAASPFADLAKRHIRELAGQQPFELGQAQLLTDNLCNLLALATSEQTDGEAQPDAQLQAMMAYCVARLGDPALSPQAVAAHFRVSVRTLHLRFAATGQSFGRWLLEQRLVASAQALRDPAQRGLGVSEIAYRFGFGDLSHFSRTFRARYGHPPRDVRG